MDHSLSVYNNLFKQLLYLLGALAFVAAGLLILLDPAFSGGEVIAVLALGFFGLCAIVFLVSIVRELLTRSPLLQISSQGWSYIPSLGVHPQQVSWEDIGQIALYRQRLRHSIFYLALEARHPETLPPSRAREMTAGVYPSVALMVMAVPLNTVFVRTTPANLERLLQRTQTRFSDELRDYHIVVDDTIHDM